MQQMICASAFTLASPVIMPTSSAPKMSQSAKNFSETSALTGAVVERQLAFRGER